MIETVNEVPVQEMNQGARDQFARSVGEDSGDYLAYRWVLVPDYSLVVLRSLVWKDAQTNQGARMHLHDLHRHYEGRCLQRNSPFLSIDAMMEWWDQKKAFLPLVFTWDSDQKMCLWDGCHRLLYSIVHDVNPTLPVLVGVPIITPEEPTPWHPSVTLRGEKVFLEKVSYKISDRVGLRGVCEDGSPWATLSVNLPEEDLAEDEIFIKDHSECEGNLDALEKAGLVRRTGRVVKSGFVEIPSALLLV